MTEQTFEFLEQTSGTLSGLLTRNDGITPVPGSLLNGLTLSVYVIGANGVISYVNSRQQQNVLQQNNVLVGEDGILAWTVQPADTTLVDTALPHERHYALFEWSWADGGGGKGKALAVLIVMNLPTVT